MCDDNLVGGQGVAGGGRKGEKRDKGEGGGDVTSQG